MSPNSVSVCVGAAILSATILVVSTFAQSDKIDADDARREALRTAHLVAPEIIETKGLLPAVDQRTVTTSRPYGYRGLPVTRVSDFWVHAETDDWILLNGDRGTATCPKVLGNFGEANARYDAMSLASVRLMAAGFEGGPIRLNVLVPRFASAPAGLEFCPGFAYDEKTRQLRVGGKYLAYLAAAQPQLAKVAPEPAA